MSSCTMLMNKLDRRSFLKSSLLTTASLSLFPALGADTSREAKAPAPVASRATGANGDIRFAVVGFNGRGQDHIRRPARSQRHPPGRAVRRGPARSSTGK